MATETGKSRDPMGTSLLVIALVAVLGAVWMLFQAMSTEHEALQREVSGTTLSVEVVMKDLREVRRECNLDREMLQAIAARLEGPTPPPLAVAAPAEAAPAKAAPDAP